MKQQTFTAGCVAALCTLLAAVTAHAAGNADWISGGIGVVEDTTAGLIDIGGKILGGGLIVVAIAAIVMQKFNIQVIGVLIVAGIMIMFGPDMVSGLFGT
jgi:hypothetical protein